VKNFAYKVCIGIIFLALFSCNNYKHVSNDEILSFDLGFSDNFANKGFQTSTKKIDYTVLELFGIYPKINIASVSISLVDSKHIKVSYYDSSSIYADKTQTVLFKGKLLRKGCFQVYLQKKRIEIPPLLPIFYSKRDVDRIRIFITTDGELLIENKWARDGNIFLMAAGGSDRDLYYFKRF